VQQLIIDLDKSMEVPKSFMGIVDIMIEDWQKLV
jgi:hypothetical protein